MLALMMLHVPLCEEGGPGHTRSKQRSSGGQQSSSTVVRSQAVHSSEAVNSQSTSYLV